MKNIVILVVTALVAMLIGFGLGAESVIKAPKWVEETREATLIVTTWMGQDFVDLDDKSTHHEEAKAWLLNW